jgi:hypothetical protein
MIRDILEEHVLATQRVFTGREQTVGASEIGLCERRVGFTKRSAPLPVGHKDRWGASTRGNLIEDLFWQPAMKRRFGDKLLWSGPDQQTFTSGYLSATPDGMVIDQPRDALKHLGLDDIGEGRCFMVECKSIDPRVDLRREKHEHAFQAQVQIGLVRELTDYRPEVSLISYIDASFLDDVNEFIVVFSEKSLVQAKKRAEKILTAELMRDLRPEGLISGGKECEYCPHAQRCGVERRNMPTGETSAVSPGALQDLLRLCAEATKVKADRDAATVEYNNIVEDIKTILRQEKTRKVPGLVSWTEVKGRTTYDYKKLKEALTRMGVDIELYSKAGEPSDRLTIGGNGAGVIGEP